MEDQVGELLKPTVPDFDTEHSCAEFLMLGDGDMHRLQPAIAHLAKHFFRPDGILQAVNAVREDPFGLRANVAQ